MKKTLLTSALFVALIAANAQCAFCHETSKKQNTEKPMVQAGDPVTRANKQTDHLSEILALSADQKEKVYTINLEKNKLVDAARIKAGENKDIFAVDRKRINGERDAAINALLTPEQQAKWKANKEAAKKNKAARATNAAE